MTTADKLVLLKADLQLLTDSNDTFLTHLLGAAEAAMVREGITNDDSTEFNACQIAYASFLFRKRAASTAGGKDSETGFPRPLRWQMNNLLFSQKIQEGMS